MISVVIPAHNAAQTLGECLKAIQSSDYRDYEVVLVDDASGDDTVEVARRHGCRVIHSDENVGAAQAKNLGARAAQGDIVLFTDADVLLNNDTLGLLASHLEDPSVAGVVGLLGERLRYNDFPSQFKNLWMYYTYTRLAATEEAKRGVGLFYTSLAAVRKEIFLQMGGFDPNYRGASVTEDIEFGQRMLTAGHRIILDGHLTVEHLKQYTLGGVLRTDSQRALGLTKTWLRKKLEPAQRATGQKYYASVPWSFMLSVPLAWLLPVFVLFAVLTLKPVWALAATLTYVALLAANVQFLRALFRARGGVFGLQSCLFLPFDLWVSGLGALWGVVDYSRGNRY